MKCFFAATVVIACAACTPAAPVSQQKMLVLPGGKFQVGGVTSDLAGALKRLGPPNETQVNITVCSDLPFAVVQQAKEAVDNAGYRRIGFAHIEGAELALCQAGR